MRVYLFQLVLKLMVNKPTYAAVNVDGRESAWRTTARKGGRQQYVGDEVEGGI